MTFLTTLPALCCLHPPAVLGKVSMDPTNKTVFFPGSLLDVTLHCQCHWTTLSLEFLFCALKEVLQPFPQLCKVRCRVKAFLYNKTFIPHWQTIENQGVEERLWDCFPCFFVALWAPPVLRWRSYPNPQHPQAAVEQAVPKRSPLSASPHSLLQKLPSLCSLTDAVISHTVMSHQHKGCCI